MGGFCVGDLSAVSVAALAVCICDSASSGADARMNATAAPLSFGLLVVIIVRRRRS